MQLRILLCALVALTAYATPIIVAPNPKSVKLISENDIAENLKDNFDVIRVRRAPRDSLDEGDAPRLEDFRRVFSYFEKFVNSDRLSKAKNMSDTMSEMVKLVMQFLKLVENHMNTNNDIDQSIE